jgi:hypothetical protein
MFHILISPGAGRAASAHPHDGAAAGHVQHPALHAVAPVSHLNIVSPLAEYDVEGSGSEDSDAPFALADAVAAAMQSGDSPSTDAVLSGDAAVAEEEVDEEGDGDDDEEDEDGQGEGSYSDVDGDSDPEDSALR